MRRNRSEKEVRISILTMDISSIGGKAKYDVYIFRYMLSEPVMTRLPQTDFDLFEALREEKGVRRGTLLRQLIHDGLKKARRQHSK